MGGIIGQIIMPGWGFLVGTVSSIIPDIGMFCWPGYLPQIIHEHRIIRRSKTEINISNIFHSLFFCLATPLIAWLINCWHPFIVILIISLITHWVADAISHKSREINGRPNYCPAFWPLPGHIKGLYDLYDFTDNLRKMIIFEGVIPSIIWFALGLYAVLL